MKEDKPRKRLQSHLREIIDNPITVEDFEANYTKEWCFTNEMFMDFLYLLHLHQNEITRLKRKLEG